MNLKTFILLFLITYNIGSICCKRGGGGSRSGGFRSSGSRSSGYRYSSYRSGGSRIGSYGGTARRVSPVFSPNIPAYWIMAGIASRRSNISGGFIKSNKTLGGEICINNEDFNGTKFGSFECPLPGFDLSARSCCGSLTNERQYCCNGYRESLIELAITLGIISFCGIIISLFFIALRYRDYIRKYLGDCKRKMNMRILTDQF